MPAKKQASAKGSTSGARKTAAKSGAKTAAKRAGSASRARAAASSTPAVSARAFMRGTRQSPYKMRLVIDQIRGKTVNEALAILKFSKKHAAVEIEKVLSSAVANAEDAARRDGRSVDVDERYVIHAIV